jgi:hypothetical protein
MEWTADEDAIVSNYVDNAQMQSNQTVFTGWENALYLCWREDLWKVLSNTTGVMHWINWF